MMIRKRHILIVMAVVIATAACRTPKTGCPVPKKNMGAEKVFDEMNRPPKKGLFKKRRY